MVAIPEHGRLEDCPLPRLLLDLHAARFDGALTLSRDRVGKRFLFQKGNPVFAESSLPSESLGVQLMDAGRLDRAAYNRVVARVESRGCKEGAALLELGLLEPRELFDALKDQVRIRIVECFGWPQGEFFVDAESETPEDAAPFRADLYSLLQAGIEAHWASDRILTDLAPRMEAYPRRSKHFDAVAERLARDAAVETLLEAIDGSRTLWRAMQAAQTPRALAAAWVLDAAGALELRQVPVGEEEPEEAAPVPDLDLEIVVEESTPAATRAARGVEPSAANPRRSNVAAASLRAEILERHDKLRETDGYALLSVDRSASVAEIKRAYLKAAKTLHPDALGRVGLDDEVREKANRVFAEIGKAYAVLSDVGRRREYDATLEMDATDLDADRLARAEMNYRKAEILIRQGNFRGALDFLRPAVELWPDESAYQSTLGWALFKQQPPDPEAAREHLETAARLDPLDGETQLRLCAVLRELGETEAADAAQSRAYSIDPNLNV